MSYEHLDIDDMLDYVNGGAVYVMQLADEPIVKIGHSTHVRERLHQLQKLVDEPLVWRAAFTCEINYAAALDAVAYRNLPHTRDNRLLTAGTEWYALTPADAMCKINQVLVHRYGGDALDWKTCTITRDQILQLWRKRLRRV